MTTEGLKSLCLALQKLEAADVATIQTPRAPGIRIVLVRRQDNQVRPRLVDFELKKKPVQTEFDWPTNQLRLFEGIGS